MPTIMPVSELQRNFKAVFDRCEKSGKPIYLTRRGSSAIVVMDAEAFDREMAIHEEVRDREMRVKKAILRGIEDFESGRYVTLDEAIEKADRARAGR